MNRFAITLSLSLCRVLGVAFVVIVLSACGGGGSGGASGGGAGSTVVVAPMAGDAAAPTVSIVLPTTAATTTSATASLALSGTATDNTGVTQVGWSNNRGGSGTAVLSGTTSATWSVAAIALQTGTNTLSVSARDAAGNTAVASIIVTYGTTTAKTHYLSPTGTNTASCQVISAPCKTFAHVFPKMVAGDELILLDGTYSEAAGTGSMHFTHSSRPLSDQIPSGTSDRATYVHALNPGKVTVSGMLFLGRSTRKDSYITVQGITFEGGADLYNTDHIYIKECGLHSQTNGGAAVLNVGTNDGEWGNTHALFEDVWVWGKERVGILIYRSNNIVVRRAVVRNDGCDSHLLACGNNNGNSMVGSTVYNSHHVSFQNVLHVDNVLGAGGYAGGADIQTAWHNNFFFPFGANEWLGSLSMNSQLAGMYPEVDDIANMAAHHPLFTYKNTVVVGGTGVSAQTNGSATTPKDIVVDGLTVLGGGSTDALRIAPEYAVTVTPTNYVRNIIATGPARFGINSPIQPSYVSVSGSFTQGAYQQTTCTVGCFSADPKANGSLKYITRIEPASPLKGAGAGGADIGANIVYQYGVSGMFYGDAGYNTLTTTALWPWPNEDRIKTEMCGSTTRGFCATARRLDGTNAITLTSYIWEALGNAIPSGIYP